MARGVTDVFQEDLDSMVGGGIYQPDDEGDSLIDDADPQMREDEEDSHTRYRTTEFDELD
jgi:hypothetical protein